MIQQVKDELGHPMITTNIPSDILERIDDMAKARSMTRVEFLSSILHMNRQPAESASPIYHVETEGSLQKRLAVVDKEPHHPGLAICDATVHTYRGTTILMFNHDEAIRVMREYPDAEQWNSVCEDCKTELGRTA